LAVGRDDVTGMTLTYPDRAVALEKSPEGRWRITQPIEADADDATIKNMLTSIADAKVTRTLDNVSDKLALYGLAPPEVTVTLRTKDGGTVPPLKIGKTTQV